MIDLVLAVAVVTGSSPFLGAASFPPPPPPPPVESVVLASASAPAPASSPAPAPAYTPPTPQPQPQQQDPPKESWAQKFLKRYYENKRSNYYAC